mmetsp:Transcript_18781/g.55654  ORF Transcript_18781/g.55654 Transcript_18781/m.55654 type:complete len:276 (-) Transcript_18781:522-1349(-)
MPARSEHGLRRWTTLSSAKLTCRECGPSKLPDERPPSRSPTPRSVESPLVPACTTAPPTFRPPPSPSPLASTPPWSTSWCFSSTAPKRLRPRRTTRASGTSASSPPGMPTSPSCSQTTGPLSWHRLTICDGWARLAPTRTRGAVAVPTQHTALSSSGPTARCRHTPSRTKICARGATGCRGSTCCSRPTSFTRTCGSMSLWWRRRQPSAAPGTPPLALTPTSASTRTRRRRTSTSWRSSSRMATTSPITQGCIRISTSTSSTPTRCGISGSRSMR